MFEHLGMDFEKVATSEVPSRTTTSLPGNSSGAANAPAKGATLYGPANEDMMTIRTIERSGDDLLVKGHAYGTMPIAVTVRPEEARRLLKLLRLSLIPFLLGFLFRRSSRPVEKQP
jgi:hypothetical protein